MNGTTWPAAATRRMSDGTLVTEYARLERGGASVSVSLFEAPLHLALSIAHPHGACTYTLTQSQAAQLSYALNVAADDLARREEKLAEARLGMA